MELGRGRSILANVCTFGGAAGFVLNLLWPLIRLIIPGPLYGLSEAITIAPIAFVVGLAGCALAGEFRRRFEGFIGLSIGGALFFFGHRSPLRASHCESGQYA